MGVNPVYSQQFRYYSTVEKLVHLCYTRIQFQLYCNVTKTVYCRQYSRELWTSSKYSAISRRNEKLRYIHLPQTTLICIFVYKQLMWAIKLTVQANISRQIRAFRGRKAIEIQTTYSQRPKRILKYK